jgi:predicted transcriptional regulator
MRKSSATREIPPPLELECLKALWKLSEGNVRQVKEVVSERRQLAYTTVMTLLDRLVKRGGATRRKVGRSFLYSPTLNRDLVRRWAVQMLIDTHFDQSLGELTEYLSTFSSSPARIAAAAAVGNSSPPASMTVPSQDSSMDPSLL